MTTSRTVLAIVLSAAIAAVGGYWVGFRQAWQLGLKADAPVRGALALWQMRLLDANRVHDLKTQWESDVDSGLMWWADLDAFPLRSSLNLLSGDDVLPGRIQYVRRLAIYRKTHASPLDDPAVIDQTLTAARAADPDFAEALIAGGKAREAAISEMISRYAR
jgi:hypothetical protein